MSAAHAGIHVVDLGGPLLALGGSGSAENQFLAMYKRALSDTHDQTLPRLAGTVALKLRGSFLVNKRIRVTAFGAPADCLVTQFRQRENKDEYKLVWDVPDDVMCKGWVECCTDDPVDPPFYYERKTGKSLWVPPWA